MAEASVGVGMAPASEEVIEMDASAVRVSGPLAGWAPGLIGELAELRFGEGSRVEHVRRLAVLSRWLDEHHLGPGDIDEGLLAVMLTELHRAGQNTTLTLRSFNRVVGFLRAVEAVPPPRPSHSPLDVVLGRYGDYLALERAVAPGTARAYTNMVRWFLAHTCDSDPDRIGELTAGDVAGFIVAVGQVRGPRSVNDAVTAVRSFLRWCYQAGLIATPLAQATPWLARARSATLPRGVPAGTGEQLIASCDPTSVVGARDRAVLTVLVRLGLRVGEVTVMELDDIDWRRGELMVRSKGGWRDPLPLPVDVGEALAAYLACRGPDRGARRVFLQVKAPLQPMTMTGIRAVVRRACRRVGIADTSTHRLRHAVATDMLAAGSPLHEIGQVLRHRDTETTAMYANVDFAALATVAREWPTTTEAAS